MKAFFAPLLEPLGAIWLCLAVCLLVLLWRRAWRSALWLALPTGLLFLVGSTPLAEMLVSAAERPYVPHLSSVAPADAVIALGGTLRPSSCDPCNFAIGSAEQRIVTAVELVHLGKASQLVLGGSTQSVPGQPGTPTMALVQNWLTRSRLITAGVTNLGLCANTHDEAVRSRQLQASEKWKGVLLVTSALHMRRAQAVFEKQGLAVQAVACDFQVYGVPRPAWVPSPFPSQARFTLLALYLHEQLGWWAYKWRGWL